MAIDDKIPSGFAISFKLFEQNLPSDDVRPSSALSNSKVSLISCPSLPIIPIKIATLSASDFPENELLLENTPFRVSNAATLIGHVKSIFPGPLISFILNLLFGKIPLLTPCNILFERPNAFTKHKTFFNHPKLARVFGLMPLTHHCVTLDAYTTCGDKHEPKEA